MIYQIVAYLQRPVLLLPVPLMPMLFLVFLFVLLDGDSKVCSAVKRLHSAAGVKLNKAELKQTTFVNQLICQKIYQ